MRYRGNSIRGLISYVFTTLDDYSRTELFRIYLTDALKTIAENTAKFAGGSTMRKRWFDIVHKAPAEQPRDACEIISGVIKKCGLEVS